MGNRGNQKQKLLRIMELFLQRTDENHAVTAQEIIDYLDQNYEIKAERKSIYADIDVLKEYGMDIVKGGGRSPGYFLASRDFELAELKLLADAVSASKFISEKKSEQLLQKLGTLGSSYEGRQLRRQVVVMDRVKSDNESVYYTIDTIYSCIDNNHALLFQYAQWNSEKKLELRHEGRIYRVSPAFLFWDNEYYYLVAWSDDDQQIRHYRVDKIVGARESQMRRGGEKERAALRPNEYGQKTFGMFSGTEEMLKLKCSSGLTGVLIDRFGTDIMLRPGDESYVIANVKVVVSSQFFGWLAGLGNKVEILSPDSVREAYAEHLRSIVGLYQSGDNGAEAI